MSWTTDPKGVPANKKTPLIRAELRERAGQRTTASENRIFAARSPLPSRPTSHAQVPMSRKRNYKDKQRQSKKNTANKRRAISQHNQNTHPTSLPAALAKPGKLRAVG